MQALDQPLHRGVRGREQQGVLNAIQPSAAVFRDPTPEHSSDHEPRCAEQDECSVIAPSPRRWGTCCALTHLVSPAASSVTIALFGSRRIHATTTARGRGLAAQILGEGGAIPHEEACEKARSAASINVASKDGGAETPRQLRFDDCECVSRRRGESPT